MANAEADMGDARYDTFMGRGPKRIPHWEHWSCPDAATALTGIDFYRQPRSCMQRMNELYPHVGLPVPADDTPIPPLDEQSDRGKGRWGHQLRDYWQQEEAGRRFASREAMLAFSPLAQGDFTGWRVVEDGDFRDEETIYQRYRRHYPAEWGDRAPAGKAVVLLNVSDKDAGAVLRALVA